MPMQYGTSQKVEHLNPTTGKIIFFTTEISIKMFWFDHRSLDLLHYTLFDVYNCLVGKCCWCNQNATSKIKGQEAWISTKDKFCSIETNQCSSRFNRKVCKNQKSINFAAWATAGFYPFVHKSYLPSFCEWATRRDATRRERSSTRSNINLPKF